MTNEEIKEFKHFLYVQGGMTYSAFMRHIHNIPWKKNEKGMSPEEYLFALRDPLHAVRYAFPWDKTAEGATYWSKVCKNWTNHYLQLYFKTRFQHAIPYSQSNLLQIIRVYYFTKQILTTEPDLSDYMRKETIAQMIHDNAELRVVFKPMTINPTTPAPAPTPAPELIQFDDDEEEEESVLAEDNTPQPSSSLACNTDDYTFFDFGQHQRKGGRAHFTNRERIISVYCNSKGALRFGRILSDEIIAQDLRFLRVRVDNLTNELCIVLTRSQGCPLYYQEKKDAKDITICANNRELQQFLQQFFDLPEGTNYLLASKNKANSSDFITYVITKYNQ